MKDRMTKLKCERPRKEMIFGGKTYIVYRYSMK